MFQFEPYSLKLKEPFGTAHGIRDRTDGMLVVVGDSGKFGFGEVFMPPYYPENQETMARFFGMLDADEMLATGTLEGALDYADQLSDADRGAKAAVDIALHDLFGRLNDCSFVDLYPQLTLQSEKRIETSYTIGFDAIETMIRKASEAGEFRILKIKLNGENDVEVISRIRQVSEQTLYVDANQGWRDLDSALDTARELVRLGVELIEQPFEVGRFDDVQALRHAVSVPIVADEDLQTVDQLARIADCYDAVNIKLMKAGGIRPAITLIEKAVAMDLKILLGCMTESSIGISAAGRLAAMAEWCDLDGNLLIENDTCTAIKTVKGRLLDNDEAGIGIKDDSGLRRIFKI